MNEEGWGKLCEASPSLSNPKDLLQFGPDIIVKTRGRQGCSVYTKHETTKVKAPDVKAVDSTGAGDAFAAAFTKKIIDGGPAEEAARYASTAAALSTTKMGAWASMPTDKEISGLTSYG
jgi:sugar/nucleoside kinase (ribokinase family)